MGDDFELKVRNGNEAKMQPNSTEKYTTTIKAVALKYTEFQVYQPRRRQKF
jgi:hypothetical protein